MSDYSDYFVRPARTGDVRAIRQIVDTFSPDRRLLSKETVALYEDVPEFVVAQRDGEVIGCGALHVMWEDLGEVRTLGVHPSSARVGVGSALLAYLLDKARDIGVKRVFVLTFETDFFSKFGFKEIEGTPVSHDVFTQLLRSYDEGVAEFLDLARVKPNTLGNTRMLLVL